MTENALDPDALPLVDLADPELWQDPAAALAPAREAAPLARTARGERVVLRYADTDRLVDQGVLDLVADFARSLPCAARLSAEPPSE